jgi:dynein intermediate chain 2
VQISDVGLHSLSVEAGGRLIAAGAHDGATTLLELCDGLYQSPAVEKSSISQMFERETKREKNLEARAKELRLRAKKGAVSEEKRDDASDAVLKQVRSHSCGARARY